MPGKFNPSNSTWVVTDVVQANVTGSAGATYTAAEQGMINSLVTAVNSILKALRDANIIG